MGHRFIHEPCDPGDAYYWYFSDSIHKILKRPYYNPKRFSGQIMKFPIIVALCATTSFLAAGGYTVVPQALGFTRSTTPAKPMIIDNGVIVHRGTSCNIKGNISINSGERIYHVPGQHYYAATKISPQYGERWFCSENEARAAGWRKAGY
jgi:hypothetical protein